MSSYAIVETGAKQYRVETDSVLEIEKLDVPEGQPEIALDKVLLIRNGDQIQVGSPFIAGAKVVCESLGNFRGPKVISLKYRRRKASRRKKGHRQDLLRLRVKEIVFSS